jgi:hypothetical protein
MTDETLEEIKKMLNSYSFTFTLCDARRVDSIDGSVEYAGYCGVLQNMREFVFEPGQLKKILTPMKELGVHLTVHPEVRSVRRFSEYSSTVLPIGPDEMMVCFIHDGLIQTFEETSEHAMVSLKRNFLYFQEEENILESVKLLTKMGYAFAPFRKWESYGMERIVSNSNLLRTFLLREADNMPYLGNSAGYRTHLGESGGHMEDAAHRAIAQKLCLVVRCLEMVCRGE